MKPRLYLALFIIPLGLILAAVPANTTHPYKLSPKDLLEEQWKDYLNQDLRYNVFYSNSTVNANQAWMLTRQLGYQNNFVLQSKPIPVRLHLHYQKLPPDPRRKGYREDVNKGGLLS